MKSMRIAAALLLVSGVWAAPGLAQTDTGTDGDSPPAATAGPAGPVVAAPTQGGGRNAKAALDVLDAGGDVPGGTDGGSMPTGEGCITCAVVNDCSLTGTCGSGNAPF